jgi:polyphosphate kinase
MNGGDDEVYLASADWMTRNLDKRIELMWPIENQLLKARVIAALRAMFRDNTKAWSLNADGAYQRRSPSAGEPPFRVQEFFQQDSKRAASVARDAAGITLVPEERHKRRL